MQSDHAAQATPLVPYFNREQYELELLTHTMYPALTGMMVS